MWEMVIYHLYLKLSTVYVDSRVDGSWKWVSEEYGVHNGEETKITVDEFDQWVGIKDIIKK